MYIWEVIIRSPEVFGGLSVLYRNHRRGSGGPPGGCTCPGGLNVLNMGGNQTPSGLVHPQGPKAPRVWKPKGKGAPPPCLGGKFPPPGRPP